MAGWIVFCVESDMGSICLAFDCDLPFFFGLLLDFHLFYGLLIRLDSASLC